MNEYILRLKKIVDLSYDIVIEKIVGGSIKIDNEAGFQLQFAYILKSVGELCRYSSEDVFSIELEKNFTLIEQSNKSKSNKAKIDIYLTLGNNDKKYSCGIEMKYFKKENHREPNNRYDVFSDIKNLEMYEDTGVDVCYFIIGTDHKHYVDQENYSENTKDFDFRNEKIYVANKVLSYRTDKPYGPDIILRNNYNFIWDMRYKKYFMKLEIKNHF